ncbi:MAG: hypothetical protein OJJ21_22955 [Ferrovibrio sp.]|uniref:hypothetical protein n=1 Tax=Ferrovibrio sp. TaxID=1917215 RepID=UPI00260F799F|nr:hypothetical protein [Ferrovibrio sp.]MCW0236475.1 hypothetical protein [Ferrovibrio sp.]
MMRVLVVLVQALLVMLVRDAPLMKQGQGKDESITVSAHISLIRSREATIKHGSDKQSSRIRKVSR